MKSIVLLKIFVFICYIKYSLLIALYYKEYKKVKENPVINEKLYK